MLYIIGEGRKNVFVYSNRWDMVNMTTMPININVNCLTDSLGFSSSKSSGNTVTKDIWRKPPAVNGIIQDVFASKNKNTFNFQN